MSPVSKPDLNANGTLETIDLSEYDPEQSRLMDERCIVVDGNDRAIGALDKKTCECFSDFILEDVPY